VLRHKGDRKQQTEDLRRYVVGEKFLSHHTEYISKLLLEKTDGTFRNFSNKAAQAPCIHFQKYTLSTTMTLTNAEFSKHGHLPNISKNT